MILCRALWGDYKNFENDISTNEMFSKYNETVFVWGEKNNEYLSSLGYKTILVSNENNNSVDNFFINKLISLSKAYEIDREVLFLDWDVKLLKPIDTNFFIQNKNPSMSLYAYPKNYHKELNSSSNLLFQIQNYSWKFDDMYVIPNACFIYFNGFNLGEELLKLHKKYKFSTLIEEFAFYKFCNVCLDDYIKKYNTNFIFGRKNDSYFYMPDSGTKINTALIINDYIKSLSSINEYFQHN